MEWNEAEVQDRSQVTNAVALAVSHVRDTLGSTGSYARSAGART